MAIALVTAQQNSGAELTVTTPITIDSVTNMVVAYSGGRKATTGITFNGTAMTEAVSASASTSGANAQMYYILKANLPTAGEYNVVATYETTSAGADKVVGAVALSGVSQSTPEAVASTSQAVASTSQQTMPITTVTDNAWVIDVAVASSTTLTRGSTASQEALLSLEPSSLCEVLSSYKACSTAGVQNLYYTQTSSATTAFTFAYTAMALTEVPPNLPPTVELNTPTDEEEISDYTPELKFTGTDPEGDDIEYEVQIDTVNTFDSQPGAAPVLIDSYSESNADSNFNIVGGSRIKGGNSFTGVGGVLNSAKFYVKKNGSPTGNCWVEIWSHSGTFGTSSVGNALLATSDVMDISTVDGASFNLVTWNFTGAEKITIDNGTKYVVVFCYENGDVNNCLFVNKKGFSSTHAGNGTAFAGGSWSAFSDEDYCFYVYIDGAGEPLLDKLSVTPDDGFENSDDGGDTHPFNSGQEVTYTVQSDLEQATYYWRVRALDPSGSNTWGDWSSPVRSFTISGTAASSDRLLYTKGIAVASSDRLLYTRGKLTNSSDRLLYSKGGLAGSSDRLLYSKGISTGSTDRGLYTKGKLVDTSERLLYSKSNASGSSDRLLYSEGFLTSSSERLLYSEGCVSASSDRGLYSKGVASSDSDKLLYTRGVATNSSDRLVHTTGKLTGESDRLLYVEGESGSTPADSDRLLYSKGSVVGSSDRLLYSKGIATSSGERLIYSQGCIASSSDRQLYSKGVDTGSSDRLLYSIGKIAQSSDRNLYTKGVDTSSSDRLIHSTGSLSSSSERLIYSKGNATSSSDRVIHSIGGGITSSDRLLYSEGRETDSSDRLLYSKGVSTSSSERLLHTGGKLTGDSDRLLYSEGSVASSSDRLIYTTGQIPEGQGESDRNIYTKGVATSSSERNLHSIGGGITSSERLLYTLSDATSDSARGLFTKGVASSSSDRLLYEKGVASNSSDRNIYTEGIDVENESTRGLYTKGIDTSSSERNLHTIGGVLATSERGIYTSGRVLASSERSLHTTGASTGVSKFKRWNGTAWVSVTLKRYNGSSWDTEIIKRYNGSTWEDRA